ncbi:BglG family transcription antiterminator [Clostridium sp. NSJ-145]|uniref:BglG family transcription antiterminator n=1 Tax=Clostridium sp. NSJ-145 TaxID=2897777 RepID=UPI001E34074A|nr:BglG family transcription antiterminator [Clostridium sp. NSJ-145]MCD2503200.1 BglG family transcription antiterminator [Clostridium sp. NSJ-145]MDY3360754.1 BglG family transcription antiterminator [Clostridium celatum]
MKIRQKLLLNMLLKSKQENIKELAKEFNVSVRTIRNDLEDINLYLEEVVDLDAIKINSNNVYLNVRKDDELKLNAKNKEEDYYTYRLSAEERVVLILSQLILSESYLTISSLCEKLSVSRGTINSDIVLIKKWSKDHSVNLISQKGKGLKIDEPEKRRRFLLMTLIRECNDLINKSKLELDSIDMYEKLFKNVVLDDIREIIMRSEKEFELTLSDIAFDALLIHIALAVERNIDSNCVSLEADNCEVSKESTQYKMAEYMIKEIEKKYQIVMPAEEVYYVALHIYGKLTPQISDDNEEWIYIQLITNNLIEKVSRCFNVDFRNDIRLYEDLSKHIAGTIFRFKNNLTLKNPLREALIDEYKDIYYAVENNSTKIIEYINQELTSDEIAYIVLHFAAAMERVKIDIEEHIPSVIIVCSTGIGTAKLVLSRLNKYFNFNVKKVIALHNLKKTLENENVDLIISTIKIDEKCNHVVVSPLLKNDDVENINSALFRAGFAANKIRKERIKGKFASDIYKLLEKYGDEDEEEVLREEIRKLLNKEVVEEKKSEEERGVLMLSEVLKREYISLDVECKDWIDAIKASGEVLKNNGIIENDYIIDAIKNVQDLGPYIVITKGVAIPHANNKLGVNKTAISLVSLKTPVNFSNSENDPVKYVFMLATKDSNSHVLALADLVNLLEDKNFFKCIDDSIDGMEIINYIKENETKI